MEAYLTFETLKSRKTDLLEKFALSESRKKYLKEIKVFLSHRHTETEDLINSVKGFFSEQGASLYIDWQDKDMPPVTNEETAIKLKTAIKASNKFVVLATPKSIESIWIPWEIGLADQMKGLKNIALLPIVEETKDWQKREYYNLYSRIVKKDGIWKVIEAEYFTGTPLKEWLNN